MRVVRLDGQACLGEETVVCLGFFDGVHIGHRKLIEKAKEVARPKNLAVCVHTFAQMPARVLRLSEDVRELTPLAVKAELLCSLGVDIVAVSEFDEAMAHMRAADFFHFVLMEKLRAQHLVVGFHHRFGFRGEAGVQELEALCIQAGVGLSIIPPVTLKNGELVSSTAIRRLLSEGDLQMAEIMLGRPY